MTGQVKARLISITEAVEKAYDVARDADWDGSPSEHLWAEYRRLKEKLDRGEIYEPLF
tara:strand:+ start:981 stop:1154 length:174 start_codon:yes stop_codon:yes gene_type:complete